MKIDEVKDFCRYEVYEIVNNEVHTICLCKERKMAEIICKKLAYTDPNNDIYFYTNVVVPNTFVVGGGWYVGFRKNKNGKLEKTELS